MQIDERYGHGSGDVRILGTVYHSIGPLLPSEGHAAKFAQLYMLDADQLDARSRIFREPDAHLSNDTLAQLQAMLLECNPLVKTLRSAHEVVAQEPDMDSFSVVLKPHGGFDAHRFNAPTTSSELGGFSPAGRPEHPWREIKLRVRGHPDEIELIDNMHPLYMPLHFVLLFPRGEPGWNADLRLVGSAERLTPRAYGAYQLQWRDRESNCLLRSGKLLQEYIIDLHVVSESLNMKFYRLNQDKLRHDVAKGAEDALHRGDHDMANVGTRVVLPSSFVGGPRYHNQKFQDAMAVTRRFGKPDLFLTFTCNPTWDEIDRELLPGQIAKDRPDVVARVFRMKLRQLMSDLTSEHALGRVVAHMRVVEFQKRGLPHAHILLWLESEDQPHEPADYDQLVCAELPPPEQTRLFEIVKRTMMHGPCGGMNPACPCMRDGECKYKYPREFVDETHATHDGYPMYRRRNDGRKVVIAVHGVDHELDNRWVVPYNPHLSAKYNCHINVEICNSVRAIKYILMYLHKGRDCAEIGLIKQPKRRTGTAAEVAAAQVRAEPQRRPEAQLDEIKSYVEGRYISATEAVWHTFGFEIHHEQPAVTRLALHLEGHEGISFRESDAPADVLRGVGITTLTAWMLLNVTDAEARKLLYQDIPEHYTWDLRLHEWKRRNRSQPFPTIGRMYAAHPAEGERYYLRVVLSHVMGAQSFEQLRTFEGIVYPTYQQAAAARGLLAEDREWESCLRDGAQWRSARALRELFATILVQCSPADPRKLWQMFKEDLADDFCYRFKQLTGLSEVPSDEAEQLYREALAEIGTALTRQKKLLSSWEHTFPELAAAGRPRERCTFLDEHRAISAPEQQQRVHDMLPCLNTEQLAAYNTIASAMQQRTDHAVPVLARAPALFFLDSAAGCGKTYVMNLLLAKARSMGLVALACATSGVAAVLLDRGATAHSTFKLPLDVTQVGPSVPRESAEAELLHAADVIVWDEAPAAHRNSIQSMNETLQDLGAPAGLGNLPFAGKVIIMGGDFRQTLPVVRHGGRAAVVNACINRASFWHEFRVLQLRENMRVRACTAAGGLAPELSNWSDFLLRVGEGRHEPVAGRDTTRSDIVLPAPLLLPQPDRNITGLITAVFGNMRLYGGTAPHDPYRKLVIERGILTPRNRDMRTINRAIVDMLPGNLFTHNSGDVAEDQPNNDMGGTVPVEYLHTLNPSGLPPHELRLKEGMPVMLLRNLDPSHGLTNGTRLLVRRVAPFTLELEVMTGHASHVGTVVFLPRISLYPNEGEFPFIFSRRQYPIMPAFAITINKGQGQTFLRAGVFLPQPVFSHGQLYVALSRVGDPRNMHVLIEHRSSAAESQRRTKPGK